MRMALRISIRPGRLPRRCGRWLATRLTGSLLLAWLARGCWACPCSPVLLPMPLLKLPPGAGPLKRSRGARRFYTVLAAAMVGGLAIDFAGLDAVKMLFWSAVVNGALAPPLILLVVLLTSNRRVMGEHVNSSVLRILGWVTFALMSAATVGMLLS